MEKVSKQYKADMDAYLRNRGYISVSVGAVNQVAQSVAEIDSDGAFWSDKNMPLTNDEITDNYATFEQNWLKADGSQYFLPETTDQLRLYRPYVSETIAEPVIINLGARYTIKGLTLDFGDTYPTKLRVETDDFSYDFDNNLKVFVTEKLFGDVTYLKIIPKEMVGGQQRLRLYRVTLGVGLVFQNDMVSTSTLKTFVSPVAESMSTINFSLTVLDKENRFNVDDDNSFINFLEVGQNVDIAIAYDLSNGSREYINMGHLMLNTWKSSNGKMQFTARDRLMFFTSEYGDGDYIHTRTLYDDAIAILTYLGLEVDEYSVDECLMDIEVSNPLPRKKCSELLQLICNAGRCVLTQDREGKIVIKANFANILNPQEIVISGTGEAAWSNVKNVINGTYNVYADLTRDFFALDDSQIIMPKDGEASLQATSYVSAEVADSDGLFEENPTITWELPSGVVYYGLSFLFDGNPPQEFVIHTYYGGEPQEDVVVTDTSNEMYVAHDFLIFDKFVVEFTKAYPNDRVVVNTISLGDLTDYTLTRDGMVQELVGARTETIKQVRVRQFHYENKVDDEGEQELNEDTGLPEYEEVDDEVYSEVTLGNSGEIVTFENVLVSDSEHADLLAIWLGNHYRNNYSYSVKYRGEPRLDAADLLYVDTNLAIPYQAEIETNTFTFNGAFGGTLAMRKALNMMNLTEEVRDESDS